MIPLTRDEIDQAYEEGMITDREYWSWTEALTTIAHMEKVYSWQINQMEGEGITV